MNDSHFLSLAWTQLIQVSILIAVVWLLVKLFARQRPHLAYALWLLVLVKCVTPPVMSSPAGLMSHLTIPKPTWLTFESPVEVEDEEILEPEPGDLAPELPPDPLPEFQVSDANFEVDDLSRGIVIDENELPPEFFAEVELEEEFLAADEPPPVAEPDVSAEPVAAAVPVSSTLWKIWLGSAGFVLLITIARVLFTLRRVYRNRVETPENLAAHVSRLSTKLRLRRKVSVLVTAARVGPAVVGIFRPLLILPKVIVFSQSNVSGGSLRSTPATPADSEIDVHELEPIIAHELLHVKRGDLGVGWLQVLVQSLWWFHPLVWLVNRFLSREAERCCDEAVLAELDCPPPQYARCLLNVLEQKRNLTPIPACPGVKPVELTKQRMERIMKLGQGCRKRSPWWCWLVVVLLGAVVLPGEAANQQDRPAEAQTTEESVSNDDSTNIQIDTQAVVEEKPDHDDDRLTRDDDAQPKRIHIPIKTYQVSSLLNRLQTEYGLNEAQSQIVLRNLFYNALNQVTTTLKYRPEVLPRLLREVHVSRDGRLIVNAANEYQEAVKELIDVWEKHNFTEITINTCVAVRTTGYVLPDKERRLETDPESKVLDETEVRELIEQLQQLEHTRLSFLPKANVFNGASFGLSKELLHPFITDYENGEPKVEAVSDGFRLRLKPVSLGDGRAKIGKVKIECEVNGAKIIDVATKQLSQNVNGKPAEIQIPERSETEFAANAEIRAGETLAIWGPEFKGQNQRIEQLVVFVTPQVKEIDLMGFFRLRGQNDNLPEPASSFSPIRPVPAAIARLSDDGSFLTFNGEPVTASHAIKHIASDLRDQKQDYEQKHSQLVEKLSQPFDASYHSVPLKDVLCEINGKTGIVFVANTDEMARAGLSLDDPVDFQISGVSLGTVLRSVSGHLGYCTLPIQFLEADGKVEPLIYLSIRPDILDVSLALRARSIPVICAPDDFQDPRRESSPTRRKILQKLDEPISLRFEQTRFTEAMKQLADKLNINVYVEAVRLPEGMESITPINFQSDESTTLREDLATIGAAHGLTFHAEDEVLKVTGTDFYENQILTMVYSARDLWPENVSETRPNPRQVVVDHVRQTFAPETWQNSDEFKIVPHEDYALFFVRQRRKVHEQIRDQAAQKRNRVDCDISVDFQRTPLLDALQIISEKSGFEITLNQDELKLAGLTVNIPVTFSAKNTATTKVLQELLNPLKLVPVMETVIVDGKGKPSLKITVRPQSALDRQRDGQETSPETRDDDITGRGVIQARIFPNPVAADEIDTVQLQFLGLKWGPAVRLSAMIGALDQSGALDFSMKPQKFRLPGRTDLTPGKKYFLRCWYEPVLKFESYWTLEIPDWNDHTRSYLSRNTIPLQLPLLEPGQKIAEHTLFMVAYLPHSDEQAVNRAETLVNSQLDPGFLEKVKQRGTILAVLRSHSGKLMSKSGVDSDSGVTGTVVVEERNFDLEPEPISEKDIRPRNKYDREITVRFEDVPLKTAVEKICELGDLQVDYDEDELAEEGVALSTPVSYAVRNETALQALSEMLKPFKLELDLKAEPVDQNGEQGVKITIRPTSVIDRVQIAIAYPIGDLLEKDKSLQGVVGVPMLDKIPHQDRLFKARPRTKADRADTLIDVLEKALAWDKTEADDTTGIIKFSERTEALVIRCNRAQHELIAKLLCERRTACGIEVKPAASADEESSEPDKDDNSETGAVAPEVWQILVQWEQTNRRYKRLSSRYRRFVYDSVFQVEKRSEGTVFYEAPDKGRMDIEPVIIAPNAQSQKLTPQGKPFSLKRDDPEIWIRNGKQVAQAKESRGKFYMLYNIPEKTWDHYTWLSMFGPAGEFLGGMSAKEAVERYHFTLQPNTDEHQVWMEVLPKRAEDKRNWKQSYVILDRKSFLPLAIQMFDPAGTTETVYRFENFKVNGNADEGLFDIPDALKDYKRVQLDEPMLNFLGKSKEQRDDESTQGEPPVKIEALRTWSDLRAPHRNPEPPVPAESKPDQPTKKDLLVTISYPVADLVLPMTGFESPIADRPDDALKSTSAVSLPRPLKSDETIHDVKFEGLKSIAAKSLLSQIGSQPGKPVSPDQIRKDARALYNTNSFDSIEPRVDDTAEGLVVVFRVHERTKEQNGENDGDSSPTPQEKPDAKPESGKPSPNPPTPYRTHVGILTSPTDQHAEKRKQLVAGNMKSLAELIQKSVPVEEGWHPDGKAKLMVSESTLSLVIRASRSTHNDVAELLKSLRREQDLLVTFECEVVTLTDAVQETFFERLNVDVDSKVVKGNRVMSKPLHLHDPDGMMIAVKELDGAKLLASPKLTTFNGVGAQIQISGPWKERNMHYMIVPTASEDRRTVDVRFAVNPTSTLDVLSKAKSMTVPDGQSVLIEVTDELLSPPKRTGVPEVDKALRELKKKELGVRTFVLLTPRIIIQEEEEALLLGPAEQDGK